MFIFVMMGGGGKADSAEGDIVDSFTQWYCLICCLKLALLLCFKVKTPNFPAHTHTHTLKYSTGALNLKHSSTSRIPLTSPKVSLVSLLKQYTWRRKKKEMKTLWLGCINLFFLIDQPAELRTVEAQALESSIRTLCSREGEK